MRKTIWISILIGIIIIISFLSVTFFNGEINIDSLNYKEISYNLLPNEVKKELQNIYLKGYNNDIITINIDEGSYIKKVKKTGPWVDYILLENTKNKYTYRIPTKYPYPYIIYNNKLYLSKNHNAIMINSNDIFLTKYIQYILK